MKFTRTSGFGDCSLRGFLAEQGQALIAEHFDLSLTVAESIIESACGVHEGSESDQLFFLLNTGSSFPLCLGHRIEELEAHAQCAPCASGRFRPPIAVRRFGSQ